MGNGSLLAVTGAGTATQWGKMNFHLPDHTPSPGARGRVDDRQGGPAFSPIHGGWLGTAGEWLRKPIMAGHGRFASTLTSAAMDIGFYGSIRRRVDGALWHPFRGWEPLSPERLTQPRRWFLFSLLLRMLGKFQDMMSELLSYCWFRQNYLPR